jgi:hypothetical protein
MKKLFAVSTLALSFSAFADSADRISPADWLDAHPSVQVSVIRGDAPDTFKVNAVVSDTRTGKVLATPLLITRAGTPARAQIGADGTKGMVSVTFTVTVDASGKTAAYSSEIRDNSEVVASQSATLAVTE